MDTKALIDGSFQELTGEQAEKAANFHKNRTTFAWVNGKLVFNETPADDRDHQHWLAEEFGITTEEFESIPRGYIVEGKVQLFIGSSFEEINLGNLTVTDFTALLAKHNSIYPNVSPTVCNGVAIGEVGEIWEPITVLGTYPA